MVRHYTVDEANDLIPVLTPVVQDLQGLNLRLNEALQAIQEFELRAKSNGHGEGAPALQPEMNVEHISREMQQRLVFLERQGIQLKDVDAGVLDFPTRIDDRDALLCWRLGEERVAYWHDLTGGYAGRQPL